MDATPHSYISSPSFISHPAFQFEPENLAFSEKISRFFDDFFRFSHEITMIPFILTFILNVIVYESVLITLFTDHLSFYTYCLCISLFQVFNFVMSLFYCIDFVLKAKNFEKTSQIPEYNMFFFFCDGIAGPVSFALCFKVLIIFEKKQFLYVFLLMSFKIFSFRPIRRILFKLYKIFPLIPSFLLYLFVYSYIFSSIGLILFFENDVDDWGNYAKAFFAVFQMLTMDNWGRAGLKMYYSNGHWMGMVVVILNFSFNYCFFSYFVGCVVDYLGYSDEILDKVKRANGGKNRKIKPFIKDCIWGTNYDVIIKFYLLIKILKELLFMFGIINFQFCLYIALAFSSLNFAHFIVYYSGYMKEMAQIQRENSIEILVFVLNLFSGPFAFLILCAIYQNNDALWYMNAFLLLKVLTINPLKFILFDNLRVIKKLYTIYLFIFIFAFLMGLVLSCFLHLKFYSFFGTMSRSFFTLLEIITVDGWASNILVSIKDYLYLAPLIEIAIVLAIHYLLFTIINALASKQMNLIYCKRSGVQLPNVLDEEEYRETIVLRRSLQEIIENSLEILGLNENFMRRHAYKRKKKLLNNADKFICLSDPEAISNYYILKKAINDYQKYYELHFSIIKNKFINKNLKIKALSNSRSRNMIFYDSPQLRKSQDNINLQGKNREKSKSTLETYQEFQDEECVIYYKNKSVKVKYLHLLKINNNVKIIGWANEMALINQIKIRAGSM